LERDTEGGGDVNEVEGVFEVESEVVDAEIVEGATDP
jgi:hypothetical protein